jgi:hypothetical protein
MEYSIDEVKQIKCSVCDEYTRKKCICRKFYCSVDCQKKDWEEHKNICHKQKEFEKEFKKFYYDFFNYFDKTNLMTFRHKQKGLCVVLLPSMDIAKKNLEENKIPFYFINNDDFKKDLNNFYLRDKKTLSIWFENFDITSDLIVYVVIYHDFNYDFTSGVYFFRDEKKNPVHFYFYNPKEKVIDK